MARIVVVGGGVCGLLAGTLLARDGHEVVVVERDPAEPVESADEAWASWERKGVTQFRLLHYLQPRFRVEAERELPELLEEMDQLGAVRYGIDRIDVRFTGGSRPGDEAFDSVTGRRPMIETAVARLADRTTGLTVRRGAAVTGFLAAAHGPTPAPHVTGVRLESGEELTADLVVDAAGRRSAVPRLLEELGARAFAEEHEDVGLIYYGRHFRSDDGTLPNQSGPILSGCGTFSVLTLPADNGTCGLGILAPTADKELRGLKDVESWERVWRSVPHVAPWLQGTPISDGVAVMPNVPARIRSLVVDGEPVVTGLVLVADSWSCTNPSVGRGISIGLLHAICLRDTVASTGLERPGEFATSFAEATAADVEPWYRATVDLDRGRLEEMDALRETGTYEPADPNAAIGRAFFTGAWYDPDLLRALSAVASMQATPLDVLAAPGLFDKVFSYADAEPPFAYPSRDELLALVR